MLAVSLRDAYSFCFFLQLNVRFCSETFPRRLRFFCVEPWLPGANGWARADVCHQSVWLLSVCVFVRMFLLSFFVWNQWGYLSSLEVVFCSVLPSFLFPESLQSSRSGAIYLLLWNAREKEKKAKYSPWKCRFRNWSVINLLLEINLAFIKPNTIYYSKTNKQTNK